MAYSRCQGLSSMVFDKIIGDTIDAVKVQSDSLINLLNFSASRI
ncbi:MAG: hypothetical protein R3Y32_06980 [Bacillota bacterium]